ncbi:MAG: hypothetical protein OJF58_002904 [Enhydrobacter sp.]|jgi:hypothetical protein|nr:hypothetical protein [Enhydrobacter sp.]WIM11944.1 MAG: hypothetical protein OJF58_002904 [Enhydrobacter sp.]
MSTTTTRRYLGMWLMIAVGLVIVGVANWHLVSVAVTSQPDCVTHLRAGDGDGTKGLYSAAQSSCTPATGRVEAR